MDYGKNRQWTAVLYNENMRSDWKEEISDVLQLPFAYCVHDKGLFLENGERRKVHTHIIIVFPSPTTYKHAVEVFSGLNQKGTRAFNTIEPVYSARHMYDYLIHDTEDCRKKGKYQFDPSERITGNNYDIGAYEQVSQQDKNECFDALTDMILSREITNYADFVIWSRSDFPDQAELVRDVIRAWSGYFDRLIRGVYLRGAAEMQKKMQRSGADPRRLAMDPEAQRAQYEGGLAK